MLCSICYIIYAYITRYILSLYIYIYIYIYNMTYCYITYSVTCYVTSYICCIVLFRNKGGTQHKMNVIQHFPTGDLPDTSGPRPVSSFRAIKNKPFYRSHGRNLPVANLNPSSCAAPCRASHVRTRGFAQILTLAHSRSPLC